jgi:hypothetical protein
MGIEIIKVIVKELPESCSYCRFLDMVYGNECPLNDRVIPDINKRPDWCPLMTHKRLLHLWRYAETGDWESEE